MFEKWKAFKVIGSRKWCPRCKKLRPLSDFASGAEGIHHENPAFMQPICMKCFREHMHQGGDGS